MMAFSSLVAMSTLLISLAGAADKGGDSSHAARKTLIQGRYRTGEVVSKTMYFAPGQHLRVRWKAKPARGNCVISLFSVFNADLLFDGSVPDSQKPPWSEIAFETFGGSAQTSEKQFQTQYISQDNPNAPPTQRGDQHLVNHVTGGNVPDIFDDEFHIFDIDWRPATHDLDSEVTYHIDNNEIRSVTGGDANYLEPPLDIYAGVWASQSGSRWACTSSGDRPNQAVVEVEFIEVYELVGSDWQLRKDYRFYDGYSLNEWSLSDWGFGGFDGAFDSSAVRVEDNKLKLDLLSNY